MMKNRFRNRHLILYICIKHDNYFSITISATERETEEESETEAGKSQNRHLYKLIQASLQQQQKLQNMSAYVPSYIPEREKVRYQDTSASYLMEEPTRQDHSFGFQEPREEPASLPKEKKLRGSLPLWYITDEELWLGRTTLGFWAGHRNSRIRVILART
ncbi:hypothetical protein CTI12_AA479980 [Artemisia annua]|uniref:Uncharacterized protein n=1 Tax=Artemisia annua TaxID=35608 RepID=A0A2U1LKW1_ARTAN|nr:hypothetical protein CTI12_AA479980 [Artemisia annua]